MARIVLLLVSAFYIVLGAVVYNRAPDRVWNRIFGVHAVAAAGWAFLNYLIQASTSLAEVDTLVRLTHPFTSLVITTTVDLAWVFPERIRPAPFLRRAALYASGLLFSAIALAPSLISHLEFSRGTVIVQYGPVFAIYGLFSVVGVVWGDVVLVRKLRQLNGLQRVQVIYVLAGMAAAQGISFVTNVLLPVVWQNSYYCRWGPASYAFMGLGMAYAIAKYHIVRPKVAIYRGLAYLLTGIAVASAGIILFVLIRMHPVLRAFSPEVTLAALGLLLGGASVPILRSIRETLTRQVMPQEQLEDSFRRLSEAILRTLDASELPDFLCRSIMEMLRVTQVSVMLVEPASGDFTRRAYCSGAPDHPGHFDLGRLSADHPLVRIVSNTRNLLHRDRVFRFYPLEEAQDLAALMAELGLQIMVPLLWEDRLLGLVCLGDKTSDDMYDGAEVEILHRMMPQASLAIRNAELYADTARIMEFNENILREMESGVIAIDADETIALFNPAAEKILGLPRNAVVGGRLALLPEGIARGLRLALTRRSTISSNHLTIQKPGGEIVPVSCTASPWGGPPPAYAGGAVAVIGDLTLLQELEHEREEAERLALIRVLSAGMAHEIRNPLVAIRTFAELLPTHWTDEEFRSNFMATTIDEIDRIVQLVSQLLMLSKPGDAVAQPIKVDTVCAAVIRFASAPAASRGINLVEDLACPDLSPVGDESRLHQALVNLITNALDAEPEGGLVRLTTEQGLDGQGFPTVTIRVYNANSCIAPEHISQIFKPFYSQKPGGTGLGLAICQTIIEEHDGTLSVSSTPGQGTEFVVRLPVSTPSVVGAEVEQP
jgi:PAS domain S-box-containing protein